MQTDPKLAAESHLGTMYQANLLKVIVNHTGLRGLFGRGARVNCDNFNHLSLDFHSEGSFKPGDKIIVDLCIGSVLARELEAVIDKVVEGPIVRHYRARFCFQDKHMVSPAICSALLYIEHKLKILASYPIP